MAAFGTLKIGTFFADCNQVLVKTGYEEAREVGSWGERYCPDNQRVLIVKASFTADTTPND